VTLGSCRSSNSGSGSALAPTIAGGGYAHLVDFVHSDEDNGETLDASPLGELTNESPMILIRSPS
jgi:predicted butyrate kinase (DUF1464 family)